jgi:hypothetical protein
MYSNLYFAIVRDGCCCLVNSGHPVRLQNTFS